MTAQDDAQSASEPQRQKMEMENEARDDIRRALGILGTSPESVVTTLIDAAIKGMRIVAIKETRRLTGLYLKESKELVDRVMPFVTPAMAAAREETVEVIKHQEERTRQLELKLDETKRLLNDAVDERNEWEDKLNSIEKELEVAKTNLDRQDGLLECHRKRTILVESYRKVLKDILNQGDSHNLLGEDE